MDSELQVISKTASGTASPAVRTVGLTKAYRGGFWLKKQVPSLKDCSLVVQRGETFGLLGPNGAGKTTLLKLLLGIVRPTSGSGELLAAPLGDRQVKQRIGYLPENPYFYDYLTGWEFLKFAAGVFGLSQQVQKERIPMLLDLVGLDQKAARKRQLRQYSKGMLQRVGMAQALINDPELVFLDEPMSGLDPLGRYQMREIILSLKAQGKTIFFNSHVLSDVEVICDRVGILSKGTLICLGSLDELLGTSRRYLVKGRGGSQRELETWLSQFNLQGERWQGLLEAPPEKFLAELTHLGAELTSMDLARPSLEEFFIQQLSKHNQDQK
ncbi:ABC transporter ATP-binding protein [Leptolyngbya sp. FACHB-261]|uniref:ABC transporter ATP-binding protein n=1 Tax=Leptolyngbya sp. FACHB-261 TaxID=2692806 RepID=UPI001687BE06|nr:ABC transporter ATP-binding protein [Leptolyngbya sp. FACHB-261]MBD2099601.1 ABC transporter ATP-binding protein [Leptolyngbya sp. FACHB-261]